MKLNLLLAVFLFNIAVFSQKNSTLNEVETLFLKNNYYLLANHYNLDMANAQIAQAKIWDNPNFGFEINAIAPENEKKYFNTGKNGEKSAYINQLIHIGGQRKNEIEIAKTNLAINTLDFEKLLLDLKYQLRQSYFTVYFNEKSIAALNKQIEQLAILVEEYKVQVNKGNISLRELVRLQNLVLDIKSNKNSLSNESIENQHTLQLLLSNENTIQIIPNPSKEEVESYSKPFKENDLELNALENRPDLKRETKMVELNNQNVKLQKSLAIPDITLGASYDQNGGAFKNQTNLTVGIPLPLWNKNKGNIKISRFLVEQSEYDLKQKKLEVINDVRTALKKYTENKTNYEYINGKMIENLETVYEGIFKNFVKQNINLLDFTDFLESYNKTIISYNEMSKNYINSCEAINYVTATKQF